MPLTIYKRKRGKVWHYRGTVAGRRLRGSTHTTDKTTALRIVAEKEARQWKGHLDGPSAVLTFAQAAMLYRASGKPERFLRPVEDYWKNTLVKDIKSGGIQHSALQLYPTAGGATRNRNVIVPTQAIVNFASKLGHCERIAVERFPVTTKERKYATREWIEAFMAHATSPQLAALACFMFATGARIGEAIELRWKDVDLRGETVLIRQTKVGSERRSHIQPRLLVALANLPGDRDPKERVFGYSNRHTPDQQWETVVRRAQIERMTFHACRHGFATALLRAGVDVTTVAKLGGWKTPALVLSTYGHASDDPTLTNRIFDTPGAKDGQKHIAAN